MQIQAGYAVIASDGDTERCEGLHLSIGDALDRARTVVGTGIARNSWVVTLVPATQAFDKDNFGNLFGV